MVAWLLLLLTLVLRVSDALGANGVFESRIGETVTLRCDGRTLKDSQQLQWMFKGQLVSSYANGTFCETGHHINRTWLRSIQQNNFSLDIINVTDKDAGVYTCRISEEPEYIQSIRLIVNDIKNHTQQRAAGTQQGGPGRPFCRPYRGREDPPGVSSGGSRVDTVGIVVPAVVAPLLVVFVVLIFICWKRQTAKRQGYSPPSTELASITEPPPA